VIQAQGPLNHPPAGQDQEGVQVVRPPDDLDGHLQPPRRPGQQLAGVAAVGPADAAAGAFEVPEQRPGGVAVLDRSGGDQDLQQQAGGADGDVPFAAVTSLALSQPVPATVRRFHVELGDFGIAAHWTGARWAIQRLPTPTMTAG
jgi:hypothetical protein